MRDLLTAMRSFTHPAQAFVRDWMRPWWLVVVVALIYLVLVVAANGGDPLALATLGTRFSEGDPEGSEGQFAYYIANVWCACPQDAHNAVSETRPSTLIGFALRSYWIGVTMGNIELEDSQEIE